VCPCTPWAVNRPVRLPRRPGAGGLADEAGVEDLATLGEPIEHPSGAVDGVALLVAGDQEADRAREPGAARVDVSLCRCDEGGDRPLHVDGTAAAERAVAEYPTERVE